MMVTRELCRLCLSEAADENSIIALYRQNSAKHDELTEFGTILQKHFWFDFGINERAVLSTIICQQCWTYIESFDNFYNLVKCKHKQYFGLDLNYSVNCYEDIKAQELPKIVIDIKEEPLCSEVVESDVVIAVPINVFEENQDEIVENYTETIANDEDYTNSSDDSEEEYKPKTKPDRKCTKRKKPIKEDELSDDESANTEIEIIRKYFKMECDQCSTKFETFSQATTHYKNVHSLDAGYLYCCDTKFNSITLIRHHCRWHENPDAYKCETCDKSFLNAFKLKSHLQIHAKNKAMGKPTKKRKKNYSQGVDQVLMLRNHFKMECDLCKEKLETFTDVTSHFKSVHNQNGYLQCCDKKFFRISRAIEHCQWHENPDLFKCNICQRTFIENISLIAHMSNMHTPEDERIYKCDQCSRSYAKEHMLSKHKRSNHVKHDGKNFECHICGNKFGLKRTLRFHIENVHENKYAQMCDICAKSFKSVKCYEMHYLSEHTNIDQKVQCELCGKWLKHQDGLKNHMRFHAAPTAQCKICGRISPNKKALRSHMKITHSPPTLKCTICEKMFKKPHALKEHIAVHTGVKDLYKCSFCPTTFRSSSNMYKHRKQLHPHEYAENKAKGLIA